MPKKGATIDDAQLEDIFRAMVSEGPVVPDQKLLDALGAANGSTGRLARDTYKSIYKEVTGEEEDPFDPIGPTIG